MKKLHFIVAGLILAIGLISCEKKGGIPNNDIGVGAADVMKAVVDMGENIPESDNGVIPEVIPGDNKGGNRTCDEVYEHFWIWDELDIDDPDYAPVPDYFCGEKVDYD
ncbi:MAG: hypothetical protein U9R49_05495, partial [Bacteroidota bacterium]|nr:hypothetical protein [Bacteroidota bacterium]